jgi:putative hydrolase of the HAD superfamily
VGARKPEAPIFLAALAQAGAPASRTLFVDDTPGHVAAAQALGLRAHLFIGAAELEKTLSEADLIGGGGRGV